MSAQVLYGTIAAYVQAGMTPTQAIRLSAVALIDEYIGPEALDGLGAPPRTVRHWRQEFRQAREAIAAADMPVDPPREYLAKVAPAIQNSASTAWDQPLPLAD